MGAERVKESVQWLPGTHRELQPYLELAITAAQQREDCMEIIYARLNEYRTENDEPTFTILCKKDFKHTFNIVYRITELFPEYISTSEDRDRALDIAQQERRENLEAVRALAVNGVSLEEQEQIPEQDREIPRTLTEAEIADSQDEDFSLVLDLTDLLKELDDDEDEPIDAPVVF